jgi:phosphoribosylamine--glycine ligase/phosphoribosylformylglycinamidine cyclo-ligase
MSSSLRILILGSGGREHALSWKLAQSPIVDQIFLAPGNGGTSGEPKTTNIDIPASDFVTLLRFALDNDVNLVVPGPEQPLIDGVENVFRKGEL